MSQIEPNLNPAVGGNPTGDSLNFDFNNTPDVKMPPDGGIRTFLIKPDKIPYLKKNATDGTVNLVAQLYINEPGHKDHDKNVLFYRDVNDPDDQVEIKQLFLSCGVKPFAGIALSALAGKQCRWRCEQSNSKTPGNPPFFNFREPIIDASLRTTPVITATPSPMTPPGPAPAGMPVPPAPPQIQTSAPPSPPMPGLATPAAPPLAPSPPMPPAFNPPAPPMPMAAPPPPPAPIPVAAAPVTETATHKWNGTAWVAK